MKHEVKYTTPLQNLGNANISFSVKENTKKMGTLNVSKGGSVWVPKNSSHGYKISWRELGDFMEAKGRRRKCK